MLVETVAKEGVEITSEMADSYWRPNNKELLLLALWSPPSIKHIPQEEGIKKRETEGVML